MNIYDMHIHSRPGEPCSASLLERMEHCGVYGGALISATPLEYAGGKFKLPYPERLRNVLQWTRHSDGRLFPFLWVHPFEKNACEIVRDAAQSGIRAFKMTCDQYHIHDSESLRLLEAIEQTGLPVLFHTGILWDLHATSQYNRPFEWECLLDFQRLRFAMGHCSWPWHDECIAVYGKFLSAGRRKQTSEMYFDLTPGTPKIYRRDLLTKLYTVGYDVENNIMFGTDSNTADYNAETVGGWLATDRAIFDELGLTEAQREKIYEKNLMRFLGDAKREG